MRAAFGDLRGPGDTGFGQGSRRPILHNNRQNTSREAAHTPQGTSYDSEWRPYVQDRVNDGRAGNGCPGV